MLQHFFMSSWGCLMNRRISLSILEIENFLQGCFFDVFFYKSIYDCVTCNTILLCANVKNIEGSVVEASWANCKGIIALLEAWIKKEFNGLRQVTETSHMHRTSINVQFFSFFIQVSSILHKIVNNLNLPLTRCQENRRHGIRSLINISPSFHQYFNCCIINILYSHTQRWHSCFAIKSMEISFDRSFVHDEIHIMV